MDSNAATQLHRHAPSIAPLATGWCASGTPQSSAGERTQPASSPPLPEEGAYEQTLCFGDSSHGVSASDAGRYGSYVLTSETQSAMKAFDTTSFECMGDLELRSTVFQQWVRMIRPLPALFIWHLNCLPMRRIAALAWLAPARRAAAALRDGLKRWNTARKEAAEDRQTWKLALTDARVLTDISRDSSIAKYRSSRSNP